jgi:aspartate--ammonia ligase
MTIRCRIPATYSPLLGVLDTERAIKLVKDSFERELAAALNLRRVTAPLFVPAGKGINDDLNGTERPVSFPVPALGGARVEIVQSLAKWKRLALAELGLGPGEGIYTDMNAVRPDEELDELHSIYVDQWDWERVIAPEERTVAVLGETVRQIYAALRRTELALCTAFPSLKPWLPEEVSVVHAEELARRFPELSPREREHRVVEERGAVLVVGIGAALADGRPHDGRAPDYDDWITPNGHGRGLNGDLLLRHPVLGGACELSSMGIRVTPESLLAQLEERGCLERRKLYFHRRLLAGELPLTMGGGIGQSRLCMLLLRKAHIGEVQASVWPEAMRQACGRANIRLL